MLTQKKVVALYELCDTLLEYHKNNIRMFETAFYNFLFESGNNRESVAVFSTILRWADDKWFCVALHRHDEIDDSRSSIANYGRSTNDQYTCTYLSTNRDMVLVDRSTEDFVTYDLLPVQFDVDDGTIFQLQTTFSDEISLGLVMENFFRGKISTDFYVVVNISRMLSTDENMINLANAELRAFLNKCKESAVYD